MANVIKLRKGLDINLKGKASDKVATLGVGGLYALVPDDFTGVKPKVVVKEGDHVKVGDALFVNKNCPEVQFASPVSGEVTAVLRGDRRKLLRVVVKADGEQQYASFGSCDLSSLDGEGVKAKLLEAGLFGFIFQLPYGVSTTPTTTPKAIFVSAFRDMPLSADFEVELRGEETNFQTGLSALSKIAKTYLGISAQQTNAALTSAKDVEVTVFDGPCPAANVDVQINHLSPVNKGETVWRVDPTFVLFIGRLFNTGRVDMTRTVALAGSEMADPSYVKTMYGAQLSSVVGSQLSSKNGVRLINGNSLTGVKTSLEDGFVGVRSSEVTAIPEGDNADEMLGWIMPRLDQFSVSRSYFSWLFGKKKEYVLDARVKGGERHMIMSGEYDKVLPMDIYSEYLIKAIIAGDIDKMEQLGIYEVAPEDFALAEFVDSSKLELQHIVREGLDMLRKENA